MTALIVLRAGSVYFTLSRQMKGESLMFSTQEYLKRNNIQYLLILRCRLFWLSGEFRRPFSWHTAARKCWSYAGLGLIPETHYCDHVTSELANQSVIVLCQWTLLCEVSTPSSCTQCAFYSLLCLAMQLFQCWMFFQYLPWYWTGKYLKIFESMYV